MADRRPLSIQQATVNIGAYFVGSNSFRGGPTSLTKSREEMVFVSNDAKITQIGISEQWTLLCEQKKLLTSRQIFRYAVPARTVTKTLFKSHNKFIF